MDTSFLCTCSFLAVCRFNGALGVEFLCCEAAVIDRSRSLLLIYWRNKETFSITGPQDEITLQWKKKYHAYHRMTDRHSTEDTYRNWTLRRRIYFTYRRLWSTTARILSRSGFLDYMDRLNNSLRGRRPKGRERRKNEREGTPPPSLPTLPRSFWPFLSPSTACHAG